MFSFAALALTLLFPVTIYPVYPSEAFRLTTYTWMWPTPSFANYSKPAVPTLYSTLTASKTPTPTIQPLNTPTPVFTSTPIPAKTITPTTTPSLSSSVRDYIMNAINNYRKTQGLSTVQTNSYTCNFAAIRAREISSGFNHDGFTNRINSKTLPYPSYSLVTENLAQTSNYQDVVNLWINSSGHAANMQKDTPYVCVEQYGNYYAYEGWKP